MCTKVHKVYQIVTLGLGVGVYAVSRPAAGTGERRSAFLYDRMVQSEIRSEQWNAFAGVIDENPATAFICNELSRSAMGAGGRRGISHNKKSAIP